MGNLTVAARRSLLVPLLIVHCLTGAGAFAKDPMARHDNSKLLDLAHYLSPDDRSLGEEVQLAVDRPDDYVRAYHERLNWRGIEAPIPALPWIALVDGLMARDRLCEIDWKEPPGDVTSNLDRLAALRPEQPGRWTWLAGAEWQGKLPEDFLPAIGKHLLEKGMALITLDIDSDSYPLMILPADRVQESQRLAALAGYGKILRLPAAEDR